MCNRNICLFAIGLLFSGCASTKQNFEEAKSIDDIVHYEAFLRVNPDSEHTSWINNRIEELKEEKRKLQAEVSAQQARLKEYEVGITTLEQFRNDKWNAKDPWLGKIGIVAFSEQKNIEYILGIQPIIDKEKAKESSRLFSFMGLTPSATFYQISRVSRSDPSILTRVFCTLKFEKGILVSKSDQLVTRSDMIALVQASQEGNKEEVQKLLAEGAKVDDQKESGLTALIGASLQGNEEVVKILIANGADVNHQMRDGNTALILASQNGHIATVSVLLENGANVNLSENNGLTALYQASQRGDTKVVKMLLEKGAEVNHQRDGGMTPLIRASQEGHTEVVKILLQNGAKVNYQMDDGVTPLIQASLLGHTEVVKILLENGADVNHQRDSLVKILLDAGAIRNKDDHSRDRDSGVTSLFLASQAGHTEVVKALLEKGARVDLPSSNNWMPLHAASQNGHEAVVKLLIQSGANVNVKSDNGKTALDVAKTQSIAQLLKEKGAH